MHNKNLITFRVFNSIAEAHVFGSKLESEGIECYYIDENMTSLYPLSSPSFGVRLQIKHEDLIKAQLVMGQLK